MGYYLQIVLKVSGKTRIESKEITSSPSCAVNASEKVLYFQKAKRIDE